MGFPRQEYCGGLPFPSSGDLPDLGIKPTSPALVGSFFTTEPPGRELKYRVLVNTARVAVCVCVCVCARMYNYECWVSRNKQYHHTKES